MAALFSHAAAGHISPAGRTRLTYWVQVGYEPARVALAAFDAAPEIAPNHGGGVRAPCVSPGARTPTGTGRRSRDT